MYRKFESLLHAKVTKKNLEETYRVCLLSLWPKELLTIFSGNTTGQWFGNVQPMVLIITVSNGDM